MLQMSQVHKWFGHQHVVAGLSFDLEKGMILGLLGPNGAGKTTTIRMLTGTLSPNEGTVVATIEGRLISPDSLAFRRHVGYCPEQPPLYPEMTVQRYLYTVCCLRDVRRRDRAAAIDRVVDALDLRALVHREISVLSKGQRQRVNIAQSLLHDPDIWVLDEPLGGLDPEQVSMVRDLIMSVGRDKAVLVSSHLLAEITQICTHILILKQGVSLLSGAMESLMAGTKPLMLTLQVTPERFSSPFEAAFPGMAWSVLGEEDGAYRYRIAADTDIREPLFRLCCAQQWPIYELHVSQKPLEELYLEVIR